MKRGFARPFILIVSLILIGLPVAFIAYSNSSSASEFVNRNILKVLGNDDVKGANITSDNYSKPGFSINIISSGTWNLQEYLCKTLEECNKSLTSGKNIGSISGAKTDDVKEIRIVSTAEWGEYQYIKYFVRSWNSGLQNFRVLDLGSLNGSMKKVFSDEKYATEAVISPITDILNTFQHSATFTDK